MKYIKEFENNTNLKEYVIWKVGFVLVILKVIPSHDLYITFFERLWIYHPNAIVDPLTVSSGVFRYNTIQIKDHVVYQSDSISECMNLDLLSSLINANKYNL